MSAIVPMTIGLPVIGSTSENVLYADSSNTLQNVSPSTAGKVLTSNGTSSAPSFQSASGVQGTSGCSVYLSTTVNYTSGATTLVDFNSTVYDLGSEYSTSTYKFTATNAGYYLMGFTYFIQSLSVGNEMACFFYQNGATVNQFIETIETGSGLQGTMQGSMMLKLSANDYLQWYVNIVSSVQPALIGSSQGTVGFVQRIA